MMEINDEKVQISREEGWIVFRVDPDVHIWVDHEDGTICIETRDTMGALMDVGAALSWEDEE